MSRESGSEPGTNQGSPQGHDQGSLEMTSNIIGNISDFDNDGTLGFVVWHSIADVRITEGEVQALAAKHGMATAPKLGSISDAFRRATSASQKRDDNGKTRYLMRPVKDSAGEIVREIVIERVDTHGKKLAHFGAFRITFDGTDAQVEDISPAHTSQNEWTECHLLAERAVKNFKEFQRSLTGKELTRFAMKCMSAMSYINLRPNGGVYFVPRSKAESLESITKFFAELSQYKASSAPMIFSSAPVPNCPVQRDQIAEGVNMTVNSDIDQMIGKLADLREEIGSVRESTLSKKAEAVAELRQKAAMYSKILETENETLAARLDLLDQTIDALFDKHAEEQAKKTA